MFSPEFGGGLLEGDWIMEPYTHQQIPPVISAWLTVLLGGGACLEGAGHWGVTWKSTCLSQLFCSPLLSVRGAHSSSNHGPNPDENREPN